MNPKIQKLRTELERNTEKIEKLQSRNAELQKQIRELEDLDIIGMVRSQGMNAEEIYVLLQQLLPGGVKQKNTEVTADDD